MFKSTLAAMVTLLIMSSTAFAGDDRRECDPKKVPGSYIGLRVSTPEFGVLDQLKLNSDGTAYHYQSQAFHQLINGGTFIPEIGTWKCLRDGTLVVTTIGVGYVPDGGGDIKIDHYKRGTQKFSVLNGNTLETIRRVFRNFLLTDDPLDPNGGTIILDSTVVFQYKRVKPLLSDVP
jgi:hypothetical protein